MNTKAIMPVHIAGLPAEMDSIAEIARSHGLVLIVDAAHAFPASFRDRPIGSIGDITCFSFYATKTLTTGEGGMICTDREDWAARCRMLSLHGISHNAWKRYTAEGSWRYDVLVPGFKNNMTDLQAALGLVQLAKLERNIARRAAIAGRYTAAFSQMPALVPAAEARPGDRHARHLYILRLNLERYNDGRHAGSESSRRRSSAAVMDNCRNARKKPRVRN